MWRAPVVEMIVVIKRPKSHLRDNSSGDFCGQSADIIKDLIRYQIVHFIPQYYSLRC